jgi:hypothetical protein
MREEEGRCENTIMKYALLCSGYSILQDLRIAALLFVVKILNSR